MSTHDINRILISKEKKKISKRCISNETCKFTFVLLRCVFCVSMFLYTSEQTFCYGIKGMYRFLGVKEGERQEKRGTRKRKRTMARCEQWKPIAAFVRWPMQLDMEMDFVAGDILLHARISTRRISHNIEFNLAHI